MHLFPLNKNNPGWFTGLGKGGMGGAVRDHCGWESGPPRHGTLHETLAWMVCLALRHAWCAPAKWAYPSHSGLHLPQHTAITAGPGQGGKTEEPRHLCSPHAFGVAADTQHGLFGHGSQKACVSNVPTWNVEICH